MNTKRIVVFVLVLLTLGTGLFAQSSARGGRRPAPSTYQVTIQSNVNGMVRVDGMELKGVTPQTTELQAGSHTFLVSAPGFIDWQQTIDIQSDRTITANLQPVVHQLTVQSNVPARVSIDGEPSGNTTLRRPLRPGNYRITVQAAGYVDFTATVNMSGDQTVNAQLQPVVHQLTVQSNVPARVSIDGEPSGNTTLRRPLRPGNYRITVQAAGYLDFTATVNMSRDQTVTAQLQPATASVSVAVPSSMVDRSVTGPAAAVTVFVDGRSVPSTSFEVPGGRHTIRLRVGPWVVEKTIDFTAGQSYRIVPEMDFQLQGSGSATSSAPPARSDNQSSGSTSSAPGQMLYGWYVLREGGPAGRGADSTYYRFGPDGSVWSRSDSYPTPEPLGTYEWNGRILTVHGMYDTQEWARIDDTTFEQVAGYGPDNVWKDQYVFLSNQNP